MPVSGHRNGSTKEIQPPLPGSPSSEKMGELKKRNQNRRMKIDYLWMQWPLLCARAYASMFCPCGQNPSVGFASTDDET